MAITPSIPYASCIIPTFNRKENLLLLLNELTLQQDINLSAIEVLVVDDGSVDGTEAFVRKLIEERKFEFTLRYFNTGLTEVNGASVARNLGIKNVQANILFFLDDDCLPHPRWLVSFFASIRKGNAVVLGNITHDIKRIRDQSPERLDNPRIQAMAEKAGKRELTELASANFAAKRECFDLAGFFDERFAQKGAYGYEDIELGHRFLMAGYTLAFCPEALVYTPEPKAEQFLQNDALRQKAKQRWWHIIQHPQENLPITPRLRAYAEQKSAQLNQALANKK